MIGIWKTESIKITKQLPLRTSFTFIGYGYGFAYGVARLTDEETGYVPPKPGVKDYGIIVKSGDIVEMHCDMEKLELSFAVNGVDYGVAYKDIAECEYKAAIALYSADEMISLLD